MCIVASSTEVWQVLFDLGCAPTSGRWYFRLNQVYVDQFKSWLTWVKEVQKTEKMFTWGPLTFEIPLCNSFVFLVFPCYFLSLLSSHLFHFVYSLLCLIDTLDTFLPFQFSGLSALSLLAVCLSPSSWAVTDTVFTTTSPLAMYLSCRLGCSQVLQKISS